MKKYVALLLLPLLMACQGKNQKIEELQAEKDSLQQIAQEKEQMISEFVNSFSEIQQNLDAIKQKEQIIRKSSSEEQITTDAKERINEDIMSIYELLLTNKKKLRDLRERLENSRHEMTDMEKMVKQLTQQLEAKNKEIDRLKNQLSELKIDVKNLNTQIDKLNTNVDSLSSENKQKESVIKEKTKRINTAYYAIGNEDELEENGVIEKKGGFLGLGKTAQLKEDYNASYFTKIDIRNKKQFDLAVRKAKVITTHPSSSFTLKETEDQIEGLKITNPDQFWSATKYLVIVVKK